jgi:hypothetical protein
MDCDQTMLRYWAQLVEGLNQPACYKKTAPTVLARLDAEHHIVVGKHRRDWDHSAGESLAQHQDVRFGVVVVARKHLAGPGYACGER